MTDRDPPAAPYVLGHSERELERLRTQARLIDPITRAFLVEAGIEAGMTVLDVGSGAGDVAFLAAELVGPSGSVIGVDRSADAVERATARARDLSLGRVRFVQADLATLAMETRFDAAIGRYVLCFQPDPAAVLAAIAKLVRPGGLVVFHEPDRELMRAVPPLPAYDRATAWLTEAYRRSGVDVRMGTRLYAAFLAAGLPPPAMRLHAVIGGAAARDAIHLDADQAVVLAAEIERLGIATRDELRAETLADEISAGLAANGGIVIGRGEIGAWAVVGGAGSAAAGPDPSRDGSPGPG